jgi:hypothetical protein
MILRRVIAHLRKQEWTAIFLDFLIVVAGILLAFQITNWNEARADRALERQYLARLHDDMAGSVTDYEENRAWDEERLRTQDLVLKSLRAGVLAPEDRRAFQSGLIFLGIHNPIRRRWGTVEELKSTGNIAVLRDIELRALIAETEGDFLRSSAIAGESLQQIQLLRAPLMQRFDPVAYGFGEDDPIELRFDFEALAADAAFISLFAHANLRSQTAVLFSDQHMQKISALRDRLEQILEIEKEAPAQ